MNKCRTKSGKMTYIALCIVVKYIHEKYLYKYAYCKIKRHFFYIYSTVMRQNHMIDKTNKKGY